MLANLTSNFDCWWQFSAFVASKKNEHSHGDFRKCVPSPRNNSVKFETLLKYCGPFRASYNNNASDNILVLSKAENKTNPH